MNCFFKLRITAFIFMAMPLLTWVGASADVQLPEMSLRYAVNYAGTVAGYIDIEIAKNVEGYELVSQTQISGALGALAALFGKDKITEATVFQIIENRAIPIRYSEQRRGRKSYHREIKFDWEKKQARYDDGEIIAIQPGETVEAGSFPLGMILSAPGKLAGKTDHVLNGKGIQTYTYSEPITETVTTPAGTFNTVKVEKIRQDKNKRAVHLWMVSLPEYSIHIPVQITSIKFNSRTTMVLESATGISLGDT